MRFVMDGEEFELTPELVRDRLRGRAPRDIQQHWVEVEGVRWPVKQALSVVTGADAGGFVSTTARRHFANLGFPVSGSSVSRRLTGQMRRSTVNAEDLPVLGAVETSVAFTWRVAGDVRLDEAEHPMFPPLPSAPGLYRFDFVGPEPDAVVLYIGESVDIARRARNYRNAKTDRSRQRTSRRIHKELVHHLLDGGSVTYSIVTDVKVGANRQTADLRLRSARRLAENVAVFLAQLEGTRVLNIDADLADEGARHE